MIELFELTETRVLLGHAVELDPGYANAQVALGIAALPGNEPEASQGPPEKAVVLQPHNSVALHTIAKLLLMKGDAPAALPHLRAGASAAPDEPINLLTYAQCLLAFEEEAYEAEADELFKRSIRLPPEGELAEMIKNERHRVLTRVIRANDQPHPRMDAVK